MTNNKRILYNLIEHRSQTFASRYTVEMMTTDGKYSEVI